MTPPTELVDDLVAGVRRAGKYDSARRRRSLRRGRKERGCWLYVPADELVRAGVDLDGPPPLYRTWGTARGGVFIRLYRHDDVGAGNSTGRG